MSKIVAISDTHMMLHMMTIPKGDILVHSGDHTNTGSKEQVQMAIKELGTLKSKFKHIVTVFGNHDKYAEWQIDYMLQFGAEQGVTVLHDSGAEIEGLKFYGAPWTTVFGNWAFMKTSPELKKKWDIIPNNTDVLITHGPMYGFGDKLDEYGSEPGAHVGCIELLLAVERVKPKLFIQGHIHEGYGVYQYGPTKIVNASNCTSRYRPINAPIIIDTSDWKTCVQIKN